MVLKIISKLIDSIHLLITQILYIFWLLWSIHLFEKCSWWELWQKPWYESKIRIKYYMNAFLQSHKICKTNATWNIIFLLNNNLFRTCSSLFSFHRRSKSSYILQFSSTLILSWSPRSSNILTQWTLPVLQTYTWLAWKLNRQLAHK